MPQPAAPPTATAGALPLVLSPAQLAEVMTVPLKTIYRWNAERTGPPSMRMGKHVRYRRQDVETWLAQRAGAGAA